MITALGLSLALLAPPALSAEDTPGSYMAQVERYSRGDREGAVLEIMTWSAGRLRAEVREGRSWLGQGKRSLLQSAVMLHTDCALLARRREDVPGFDDRLEEAWGLVKQMESAPEPDTFARRWYVAMGYYLLGWVDGPRARLFFSHGLRRFARDPELLLGLGSVAEMEATRPFAYTRVWSSRLSPETLPMDDAAVIRDRRAMLESAEREYRKALEQDPELAEAHLRLGRVLGLLGSTEEALRELGWVLTKSQDPYFLYMTHLFTGRIQEDAGHLEKATASYRAAVAEDPTCQVANLALGRALDRAGERAAATRAWETAVSGRDGDDGWWVYPFGRSRQAQALFDVLRAEAMQ